MFSEHLKEHTKVNHQQLEIKLLTILRSIRTQFEYGKLLSLFYSFFKSLELSIQKYLDPEDLITYSRRRKVQALVVDLNFVSQAIPPLAETDFLPQINDRFEALGALYVLEGSTLGGNAICGMLKKSMDTPNVDAMTFFTGHAGDTLNNWKEFLTILNMPYNILEQQSMMRSANDTFICFGLWIDKYYGRTTS